MNSYMGVANSWLLYLLAGIVIITVTIQSVYFLKIAWKRGLELGITKEKMIESIRSSAVFSIVPSIPIVISLIAIAPVLGIPFSWLRLSVIGSNSYELIAANEGAKAMGFESISDPGYNAIAFSNSMWIMSLGIIWGIIMCLFFLKKWQNKMKDVAKKDNKWGEIMMGALFIGMLSVFLGRPIASGGIQLFVMSFSALIMLILIAISKKLKVRWLEDFALSLSMIFGMALAVLYTQLGGGI